MRKNKRIAAVIPAFNEAESIRKVLIEIPFPQRDLHLPDMSELVGLKGK